MPTTVIYGFTQKTHYDTYLKNCSHGELLPYPLIKGYMQGQIDAGVDAFRLVAIDCASPTQTQICAVTMQSIIRALELKHDSIEVSYTLTRDADSHLYHVDAGVASAMHDSHESSVP